MICDHDYEPGAYRRANRDLNDDTRWERQMSAMADRTEMIAVVAMAQNRVIGDGTGLIWHLPDDLRR